MTGRDSLHHRYAVLLGLILLLLAFQLAAADGDGARWSTVVLQAATLIGRRRHRAGAPVGRPADGRRLRVARHRRR